MTDELEGVLAHELTHVRNRDVMVITLASLFSTIAFQVMQFGYFGSFYSYGNRDRNNGGGDFDNNICGFYYLAG